MTNSFWQTQPESPTTCSGSQPTGQGPIHRSLDEATAGLDWFASYGWPRAGDRESRTVLSLPRRSAAGSRHRTTDALVKMSTMQALRSVHAPGHSPCEGRLHDLRLECDRIDAASEYVDG